MEEKMKKILSLAILLCIAGLFIVSCVKKGATGAAGPTGANGNGLIAVNLQNNQVYSGTIDVTIDSAYNTVNYSGNAAIAVGVTNTGTEYSRILFRFDLTALIPANAIVEDAYLTLYTYPGSLTNTSAITAYALSDQWTETGATWSSSTASTLWAKNGGDYFPTPASTGAVLSDINTASVTFTLNASVVQGWLGNPSANYGFILKAFDETITTGNYFSFYSKDNGTVSLNP